MNPHYYCFSICIISLVIIVDGDESCLPLGYSSTTTYQVVSCFTVGAQYRQFSECNYRMIICNSQEWDGEKEDTVLYLYIVFLMAVDILCKLRVLERVDRRNDEQDGEKNWKIHLWAESDKWLHQRTVRNSLSVQESHAGLQTSIHIC